MTVADVAAVIFILLAGFDIMAAIVIARVSLKFPKLDSLRERRNVAIAIAFEVLIISFFAVNSRWTHLSIDQFWQTVVLVIALSVPSTVNLAWMTRIIGAKSPEGDPLDIKR